MAPPMLEDPGAAVDADAVVVQQRGDQADIQPTDPKPLAWFDIPGLAAVFPLYCLTLWYIGSVFVLTMFCGRHFWGYDKDAQIRLYLKKLAIMDLVAATVLFGMYYELVRDTEFSTGEDECIPLMSYKWIVLLMVLATVHIVVFRYATFGIASSDSYDVTGFRVSNPKTVGRTVGNDPHKSAHNVPLSPFYTFGLFVFIIFFFLVMGWTTQATYDLLHSIRICVPSETNSQWYKWSLPFILFMLFNFAALCGEGLLRKKSNEDIFGASMHSPFTTTTLSMTSLSWVAFIVFLYFWYDVTAGEYLVLGTFFVLLDAGWVATMTGCNILVNWLRNNGLEV